MKLYFDVDAGNFVSGPGVRDAVNFLAFHRGDTVPVQVIFCQGTTLIDLGTGATGQLGMKVQGVFDGDFAANASTWTKTGSGTNAVYTFNLNLDTTALNAELGVGSGPDIASVLVNMEMEFIAGGNVTTSNLITATIFNDVIKGDEAGAIEIVAGSPVNAVLAQYARAIGTTITTLPTNGQTTIVGGVTYTWVTSGTAANQIVIGADAAACTTALRNAVNNGVGTGGVPNPLVLTDNQSPFPPNITFTALTAGTAGNSLTVSGTFSSNWPGSFSGGVTGVTATPGNPGSWQYDASYLYLCIGTAPFTGIPLWHRIAHASY